MIYEQVASLIETYKTRDPEELLILSGIKIFENEFEKLLGMYACVSDERIVILNSLLSPENRKMVSAHELGHHVLHFKEAELTGFKEFSLDSQIGTYKYEANAFASHLLIPDSEFLELATTGITVEKMASMLSVDQNLVLIKNNEMAKLGYKLNNQDWYNSRFLKNKKPSA